MASTLVFAGVVAPVIKTISMQHTNTLTHALKVSDSELTDFKNDSAKMLASKVYTYDKTVLGLDDTTANSDVMKQCGVYNNDYNIAYQQLQQVDQQNPGQGYMSDDSQMSMIRKNNEKFNIDPVDFDRISSSDNQALLLSQLEQQGMSASDATQSINDYMSKAVPVAKTLQLNGLESNTMYNQQVDTNYRLDNENLIGTWLTDHYSNILIPKTQDQIMTSDLASHLAVYSSDGKTGYNVGDEFTKDDIASLFNFTYDMSTGLILNTPSCDYVNASSTDTDTVLPYIQTKDLSTCAVTGGST
jgi:hypothetical protein